MRVSRSFKASLVVLLPVLGLAIAAPKIHAEENADEAIRRAWQKGNGGHLDDAISDLETFLSEHAQDAKRGRLRVVLSELYQRAGRNDAAKQILRKAVDEDEDAPDAGWRLLNLLGCGFSMWSNRTWGPGETPEIAMNVWSHSSEDHPDTIALELFQLDAAKLEAGWRERPRPLEALLSAPGKDAGKKVASWAVPWPKDGGSAPVKLSKIKGNGIYLVVARPHGVPFTIPVVVASHAIVVKRSGEGSLVFAADRGAGAPLAGVSLYSFTDKPVLLGETGKDGCWEGKIEGSRNLVCAWHDGSLAASNGWWWGYRAAGTLVTHFSTDRPIYRPGHTVHWKALVRAIGASGDYELPEKGRKFAILVRDPSGTEVQKGEAVANAYGTFEGEVALKDGCPLGHYTIDLGTGTWGTFRVEEYRKPEFQVTVEAPAFVVQGGELHAKVHAKYYFGAPVTKAQVAWQVFRRPHWRPWWTLFPCEDSWFFEDEGYGYYYWGHGTLVKQGTGEIGKDGSFSIDEKVDRPEKPQNEAMPDEVVTVVAHVTDDSRREESGSAEVQAPRASFSLYAQPDRWVYRPGDDVTISVRALDPSNKPRAGVAITVSGEVRDWEDGHEKRKPISCDVKVPPTDETGTARLKLSADARGYLIYTLTAKDEEGREVSTQAYVWLADALWASSTRSKMECVADKRSYQVGDEALVLCTMPQEKGTALVTREREGIYSHSVQSWEKGVLLLHEKIEARDVPNVYVTVSAVAGQLHAGTANLLVLPDKRLLEVTVAFDKPTYQPREKAVVTVRAVERTSRKPVRCEVALGVVDASLYALAADPAVDVRKFFYKQRPHAVQTTSSFEWWVSGRAGANALLKAADAAAPAPGAPAEEPAGRAREAKDEKAGGLVEAEVRSEFPDTWVWKGSLETDDAGEARVELKTPDSLTTWRATARAITTDTKVGSATAEANVFLPVLVRTETPRFMVQGDVGGVSALVHNYLDKAKEVKVSWAATGPIQLGVPTSTIPYSRPEMCLPLEFVWITIPSQGEVRLDWPKCRAERPGKVELTVTAQTDEASDAMKAPAFPVLAHGAPRFVSNAGSLDEAESKTVTLEIPEGTIPEALELDLSITPSVAATMLDTLDSLAGYPYGCVEQTMSRFLPDVVALDTLRKLSHDEPKLRAELPKMIEAGLGRLCGFQHGDGGWGWWEHDQTHPYMTAYVVYGLTLARQADVKVDEGMYSRGVAALERLLKGTAMKAHAGAKEDANARAYMLFALALAGKFPMNQLERCYEHRDELDSYGKAVLLRALRRAPTKETPWNLRKLAQDLVAAAKVTGSACSWDRKGFEHGWTSLETETTAQVLHALEEIGEGKELWAKAVKWLVSHRRGRWWYSTKDTAMIVYALAEHLVKTNELDADEDLSISVGETELLRQHVDKSNVLSTRVGARLGLADLHGAKTVTFKRTGKGNAYWSANLRTTTFEEDMKASDGAIACSRKIEVIHKEKDGTEKRFPLGKEPVQVGDELHVTLTVDTGDAREYVLIEDPIPAGCEFVREDLGGEQHGGRGRHGIWEWRYWYCHREYRDDRLAVCATWLGAHSASKIEYVLRCEKPGDYHVLPTRAVDMYQPDVGGTGGEDRVSIR